MSAVRLGYEKRKLRFFQRWSTLDLSNQPQVDEGLSRGTYLNLPSLQDDVESMCFSEGYVFSGDYSGTIKVLLKYNKLIVRKL